MFKTRKKTVLYIIFLFVFVYRLFCEEVTLNTGVSLHLDYPWNFFLSANENITFYAGPNSRKYFELSCGVTLGIATLESKIKLKFSYLPFIDFFTEFGAGSGWAFEKKLFYGFAEIKELPKKRMVIVPYNFSEALLLFYAGFDLHFNTADFVDSKWAGLVFKTVQGIAYKALSSGDDSKFWIWKNDLGENRNGAVYTAAYSIEYNMPVYLSKLILEFKTLKKLYEPLPGSQNISERFWNFELAFAACFKPADFITIKLEPVWASEVIYTLNAQRVYVTHRKVNPSKNSAFVFKKVSASIYFSF